MGGIGKTVAQRALCNEPEIVNAFRDGVCYLLLRVGMTDKRLKEKLSSCVGHLAGRSFQSNYEMNMKWIVLWKHARNGFKTETSFLCMTTSGQKRNRPFTALAAVG